MNRNDLRFIKTEELIISTYEDLLKKSAGVINVTGLCKTARINTTTFYSHYMDLEDLHTSLCEQRLTALLEKEPAMGLLYEDPSLFVNALSRLITDNKSILGPLFAGRQGLMLDIVEKNLLHIYASEDISKEMYMKIRFCVGGAMRILSDKDGESMTDDVALLIQKIMK